MRATRILLVALVLAAAACLSPTRADEGATLGHLDGMSPIGSAAKATMKQAERDCERTMTMVLRDAFTKYEDTKDAAWFSETAFEAGSARERAHAQAVLDYRAWLKDGASDTQALPGDWSEHNEGWSGFWFVTSKEGLTAYTAYYEEVTLSEEMKGFLGGDRRRVASVNEILAALDRTAGSAKKALDRLQRPAGGTGALRDQLGGMRDTLRTNLSLWKNSLSVVKDIRRRVHDCTQGKNTVDDRIDRMESAFETYQTTVSDDESTLQMHNLEVETWAKTLAAHATAIRSAELDWLDVVAPVATNDALFLGAMHLGKDIYRIQTVVEGLISRIDRALK